MLEQIKTKGFIKWGLVVLAGLILIVGSFSLGVFVGFKKAGFSYSWGENYEHNFGGPRNGFFLFRRMPEGVGGDDFINANGTVGSILKINNNSVVIKGNDNVEKVINIGANTVIRRQRDTIKIADLKINDLIVVIGNPNNSGQIDAKFVRVFEK